MKLKGARYLRKLVEMGLIEKKDRSYVLTSKGHYEVHKKNTKNEVDELNLNQIIAFKWLLSYYKNRTIIRASEIAKPVSIFRPL